MRLQRQKRKRHSRETVVREIKKEHAIFKSKMLSGTVHEGYGSCRRICFYESLCEYFLYNGHINRMFLEASLGKRGILEGLWEIYLKNESLRGGHMGLRGFYICMQWNIQGREKEGTG